MNDSQQQQQINDFKMKNSNTNGTPEPDQQLYKSELCRTFQETGICRYGNKCQFAHGFDELRSRCRDPKYKTKVCRSWQERGLCSYGQRCQFLHDNNIGITGGTRSPSVRSNASGSPSSINSRFPNQGYSSASGFSPPTNNGQSYNHNFQLTGSYSNDSKMIVFQQYNQGDIRLSSPATQVQFSPYLSSGYPIDPKINGNFNHENPAMYGKPSPDPSYKMVPNYHYASNEENILPPLPNYQLGPTAPPSLSVVETNKIPISPTFGLRMRQAAMEYQALIESAQANEIQFRSTDPSQSPDINNLSLGLGHLQLSQRVIPDLNLQQAQYNSQMYQQQNRKIGTPKSQGSFIYNNQNANAFDLQNPTPTLEPRSNPPGFSPQSANLANIAPNSHRSNSSVDFPPNLRGPSPSEFQYLPSVSSYSKSFDSRSIQHQSSSSYPFAGKGGQHALENRQASPPSTINNNHDLTFQNEQASNSFPDNLETSPPSRVRLDVFKNINT